MQKINIFALLFNLLLSVFKIILGVFSKSIALLSDGINNIEDVLSNIVNIIGVKVSNKKADKEHPFGHVRAQYITSLIISLIIIFTGIELIRNSVSDILNKTVSEYSALIIILIVSGIIIKLFMGFLYLRTYKKNKFDPYKITAYDSFFDTIGQVILLLGIIISMIFGFQIDGYLGIILSVIIIVSGIKLLLESANKLISTKIDSNLLKQILADIMKSNVVLGYHDIIAHLYGENTIFISIHIELDETLDFKTLHDVIDTLEYHIKNKYNVEITIHPDPVNTTDSDLKVFKEKLFIALKTIDITAHDVRKIGGRKNQFVFDVVLPFNCKYKKEEIYKTTYDLLKDQFEGLVMVINYDMEY